MSDDPLRRRQRRRLDTTERTLWTEVTRDIAPLRPELPGDAGPEPEDLLPDLSVAQPASPSRQAGQLRKEPAAEPKPPPLAPLGRRMRQRIARGSHSIGGRIDLHGMTQREAHAALLDFLRSAQVRNAGIVLVITGKGSSGAETGSDRGVLRRQVPHWLGLPTFRELVVGFEPAHRAHGGEGALYVRLRRLRG